jgi:adenine-specific DNA-methyltransferase
MSKKDDIPELARSIDPAANKRAALEAMIPEAFSEGRLDLEALKRTLGEGEIIESGERYRLDWVGKSEAYRTLQAPTTATLKPDREQSVNFDTASHAFIEGENLEVLKVLQKAYFGQVKLIYIDPPYNTGSDQFVYPDRFQESKEDYLKRIQDMDDQGALLREGQFRKNSRESGHYHSNWLSMMLPRLYIARNLLREDGVIFVSIDDNEVHNLRLLMNEIFGEENFVASVIWQRVYAPKSSARHFSEDHDYVLVFAKNADLWTPNLLPRTDEQNSVYKNPDDDPRGPWRPNNLAARNYYSKGTYEIKCPGGRVISGPPSGSYWRISEEKFRELDRDNRIYWGADGNNVPAPKIFLSEVKDGRTPQTIWTYKEVGHTQKAKKDLLDRVEFPSSELVFDTPKPTDLIRRMCLLATQPDETDLVLDFFAGSGTTLDAVLQQNAEDGGDRRCILVQMAEPLDTDNAEFSDIAQVARTRIRAALKALREVESDGPGLAKDEGFRAFQLVESNFPQWRPQTFDSGEALAEQIQLFMQAGVRDAEPEALALELLLKSGYPLSTTLNRLELAGVPVLSVDSDDSKLVLLLESFTTDMLPELMDLAPTRVIALERIFDGSDAAKKNLALQCRDADIRFESY